MTESPAEGGCLCGSVRYRVAGDPVAATLCHCGSCRRASGGTNVAWAVFDKRDFEWLHCHGCGSLVGYRRSSRPDHVDITAGTLDDPEIGRAHV